MANYFMSALSTDEFESLYQFTETAFKDVVFFIYNIGSDCNATSCIPFSKANCDLNCLFRKEGMKKGTPVSLEFGMLYEKGFDVMEKVFSGYENKEFDDPSQKALQTLLAFIKNRDTYEEQLAEAMKDTADLKEDDIVIAMSEHFLGKLCPGKTYFIDLRMKRKEVKCKCGCNAVVDCKGTGIGNEYVWHGFLDVVFESDTSVAMSSFERPKLELEDEEYGERDEEEMSTNPGGENFHEVIEAMENQAAAQAIIFSMIQMKRLPEYDHFLIPFIAISSSHVRIFMYDAQNDFLLRSQDLPIFTVEEAKEGNKSSFSLPTVITVWMILHYKYFCSGVNIENLSIELDSARSGFAEVIENCPHYELLRSCITTFPPIEKENRLVRNEFTFVKSSGFKSRKSFGSLKFSK